MEPGGLTGKGVVIAIIDTGVQSDHPFLAGKVLEGYNPDRPELGTEDFKGTAPTWRVSRPDWSMKGGALRASLPMH